MDQFLVIMEMMIENTINANKILVRVKIIKMIIMNWTCPLFIMIDMHSCRVMVLQSQTSRWSLRLPVQTLSHRIAAACGVSTLIHLEKLYLFVDKHKCSVLEEHQVER